MTESQLALVIAAIVSVIAARGEAQTPHLAFRAPARDVSVTTLQYGADGATALPMDV